MISKVSFSSMYKVILGCKILLSNLFYLKKVVLLKQVDELDCVLQCP